jgi:hypothetical protein
MSQRQGRHQRRASQSVLVLPENFALEDVPAAVAEGGKPADVSEQAARQAGHVHGRRLQGPGDGLGRRWELQVRCARRVN